MNWNNAINDYQLHLKIEKGLAKNSIASYTLDVKKLILFLEENEMKVSPIVITADDIQQFIYDASKNLNARSQARLISGLRNFFDYLIFED
ncbi:MAG: site-specific integrase, partial [Bacteroidetes bacterium]|nr:site-specific integrase [Bacteroidota bacterium]